MANKSGFTLIELLIVMALIGIISTAAMLIVQDVVYKARWGKMVSDMEAIRTAATLAYADNGHWAPSWGPGVTPPELAPYLKAWPTPPCPNDFYIWLNQPCPSCYNGMAITVSYNKFMAMTNPFNLYIAGIPFASPGVGPDVLTAPHLLRCNE